MEVSIDGDRLRTGERNAASRGNRDNVLGGFGRPKRADIHGIFPRIAARCWWSARLLRGLEARYIPIGTHSDANIPRLRVDL